MVFAKFVESIGLGNFLAPKKKTGNTRKRTTKKHFKETVNEQPYEKYRKKSEDTTEEEKERYETMIKQKIAAQFEVEKDAENRDQFAKKQRVWYHNKIRDRHFNAVVVGVVSILLSCIHHSSNVSHISSFPI